MPSIDVIQDACQNDKSKSFSAKITKYPIFDFKC